MIGWRHAGGLVPAVLLAGCGGGVGSLPQMPPVPTAAYRLGAGDELRIMVPGLAPGTAFDATYVVNERGHIALPLLGDVPASGRTVPELQEAISRDLIGRSLLRQPTVSVQPLKLRPFYVLGEVKTPGEYQFRPGMSVLAAISAAGGYTFRARQREVAITRLVNGRPATGRATEGEMIQPGDTLRVYEKWF